MGAPPSMPPPAPRPQAPPRSGPSSGWARRPGDGLLGGVAAGIAQRARIDPVLVRIGFVVLAAAGGLGIVAYLVLWALLPPDEAAAPDGADTEGPLAGATLSVRRMVALGLMALGGLLLLRRVGLWLGDGLVWPFVLVAAGSAVVWARSDASSALRRSTGPGGTTAHGPLAAIVTGPASPVRIVVGSLLALGGVAGFLAANVTLAAVRDLGLALAAATVGLGLLLGPWLWRLGDQLAAERRERIRQAERAELAAHLHDSVLQTLALIQRSADQPRRMVSLARRQERELRGWLYRDPPGGGGGTLDGEVRSMAEEIEAVHDVAVEVVTVGDAPFDAPMAALLGATREACVNAAKHAGVRHVDVYVEVEPAQVLAYVRDRGAGFDPGAVAGDRRGIRDSIVGRVERHGGTATIHSQPGEGTEVEVSLPRTPVPDATSGRPPGARRHRAGSEER